MRLTVTCILIFWLTPLAIFLLDAFGLMVLGSTTGLYPYPDQTWLDRIFILAAWSVTIGMVAAPVVASICRDIEEYGK